jgi:hypothetical protein
MGESAVIVFSRFLIVPRARSNSGGGLGKAIAERGQTQDAQTDMD